MRSVVKFIKVGLIIPLVFISAVIFAQPGFTPPGQGGPPPPNPCNGNNGKPCRPIPIDSGVGFLVAAGIAIGVRKLKKNI